MLVLHKIPQILFNHSIGEGYYCTGFSCAEMAKQSKPGQFLMLRIADQTWEGKLSRPFSISNIKDHIIEIVFETVGSNTRNLANAEKGKTLSVIGPLGNGFEIDHKAQVHLLVAGGIGVAPMPYLAVKILQECPHSKVIVLFGVRAKSKLLLTEFFKEYKIELKVSSEEFDSKKEPKGFWISFRLHANDQNPDIGTEHTLKVKGSASHTDTESKPPPEEEPTCLAC